MLGRVSSGRAATSSKKAGQVTDNMACACGGENSLRFGDVEVGGDRREIPMHIFAAARGSELGRKGARRRLRQRRVSAA